MSLGKCYHKEEKDDAYATLCCKRIVDGGIFMDLRVVKTQELITGTFFDMLKEMPFSEITVKEITLRARINRSTFYRHYLDIIQLRDDCIDRLLEGFTTHLAEEFLSLDNMLGDEYHQTLQECLEFFKSNQQVYELLWADFSLGRNVFEEMILSGSDHITNSIRNNHAISEEKKELGSWYSLLLINSLMTSVRWWFLHEDISAKEMTRLIVSNMKTGPINQLMGRKEP